MTFDSVPFVALPANDGIVASVLLLSSSLLSVSTSFSFGVNYIVRLRGDLGDVGTSFVVRFRGNLRSTGVAIRRGDLRSADVVSPRGLLMFHY